ncbi:hypothetical protein [Streptomyces sp. 6N223]|uniref:hypothetical protein n=1 Tax=Streptomyces sp. 6N223 TaxID=3457412 RepID=UPI003FD09FBF
MLTRRAPSVALPATLSLASILLLSCGSEEERNYSLPEKICGVEIDSQTLEPFLRTGDTFETERIRDFSPPGECQVLIDSKRNVRFEVVPYGAYFRNPMDWARENTFSDPRSVDVEAEGVVYSSGGGATFRCHEEERQDHSETLMVQVGLVGSDTLDDQDERMDRLEDLLRSYVVGIRELYECEVPASSS